jgi:hypothetical protein
MPPRYRSGTKQSFPTLTRLEAHGRTLVDVILELKFRAEPEEAHPRRLGTGQASIDPPQYKGVFVKAAPGPVRRRGSSRGIAAPRKS